MLSNLARYLVKNLPTLVIAFLLAVVVWVSAVLAADPNEQRLYPRPIPIELKGQDPSLLIIDQSSETVDLTLNAPKSVWAELENTPQAVTAWADLTNLGSGVHTIPVQVQIDEALVRLIEQDPQELEISLESLVTKEFSVTLVVDGVLPTGYQAGSPSLTPEQIAVSGPESNVERIKELRVSLNVSNASETITETKQVIPLDEEGRMVSGVTLTPNEVDVTQPITLLGGYRYVIVKAVPEGQVANGYRLTNLYVTPVGVVVFSSDPKLVENLPGYVETKPLDLSGADDDFETLVELNLPEGISVVGDPKVLVQVSIAAIESSLAVTLPVEIVGLMPGYEAAISPETIDLIILGPVPVLEKLKPSDIRVKVDLTGYDPGIYAVVPVVDFLPEGVRQVSMIPSTVEVVITLAPTPTPTPTPPATETPALTPLLTVTPTVKP